MVSGDATDDQEAPDLEIQSVTIVFSDDFPTMIVTRFKILQAKLASTYYEKVSRIQRGYTLRHISLWQLMALRKVATKHLQFT